MPGVLPGEKLGISASNFIILKRLLTLEISLCSLSQQDFSFTLVLPLAALKAPRPQARAYWEIRHCPLCKLSVLSAAMCRLSTNLTHLLNLSVR